MTWLTDPALFMRIIIALFILSAIRYGVALDWPNVAYSAAAAVLNISILWGGK
jgi:hypothetical protein